MSETSQQSTPRMNVESFNLDHTKVAAPYVRVADRKELRKRVPRACGDEPSSRPVATTRLPAIPSPHAQDVPGWEGVSPGAQDVPGREGVSPAGRDRVARPRQAMTRVHSSRAARKPRTASWAAASEWFAPQPHWTSLAAGTS